MITHQPPIRPKVKGKRTFTDDEARLIRANGTAQYWAHHFGCSETCISNIRRGIHYKDVV